MLSAALHKAFDSSLAAEVYELTFENLKAHPFQGSISIGGVSLLPRKNPVKSYPYINSSIQLTTDKLIFEDVDILLLLRFNKLALKKIAILSPDLELDINGLNPIFLPFYEQTPNPDEKKVPDSYLLQEFELMDASFRLINSAKDREFIVENFNLAFQELSLDQIENSEFFFLKVLEISMAKFTGTTKEDGLKHLSFEDFKIKIDSIAAQKNLDTLIFNFLDFTTGIKDLDIQTRDSLFHITMASFDLSYRDKTIQLEKLSFKPNVSNAVLQKNYKFQQTQYSGSVGSVNLIGVNFDSMIYANSYYIDEVALDSVNAMIYKDFTKAKDLNYFPKYPGQSIAGIPNPVRIKTAKATHVNVINEERKPDGILATVHVNNGTLEAKNITNLAPSESLNLTAVAYLAGKVKFKLDLDFSYSKPQFTFKGELEKFELISLNPIIQAYTPAKFTAGTGEQIKFSGTALATSSTGNLKFLYYDLSLNLELVEKAKWKSDIITFGANTILNTNNPTSENMPPREVKFRAGRDMNKGFVNLIIKSILDGMKETMILSKENRKEFNQAKKEARKEARQEKKKDNN